jgi:hypothetical protein
MFGRRGTTLHRGEEGGNVAGKTRWVLEPIGTREVVSNLDTRSKSRDIHTNQCSNRTCHVTQPPTHALTCSAVTALVRTP